LRKELPVKMGKEVVRVSELAMTFWITEESLTLPGIEPQTLDPPSRSLVAISTELS
jgi:hypothetical protein